MDSPKPYLILGIGNYLLSDDGIGVHAARMLQAEPPPETEVLTTETDFLSAIPFLERCAKALVIDAMDAGQPSGTLYYYRGENLAQTVQKHSLHGLGLLGILEFLNEKPRPEVHILGVQPGQTGFGLQLSPEVASVLPHIVYAAHRIIGEFGRLDPLGFKVRRALTEGSGYQDGSPHRPIDKDAIGSLYSKLWVGLAFAALPPAARGSPASEQSRHEP